MGEMRILSSSSKHRNTIPGEFFANFSPGIVFLKCKSLHLITASRRFLTGSQSRMEWVVLP